MEINNLVRSAVVLGLGLPVTIALTGTLKAATNALNERPVKDTSVVQQDILKSELTDPCLKWALSESESSLEKKAEVKINEVLGGDVTHQAACNWVLG